MTVTTIKNNDIKKQVNRICASAELSSKKKLCRFLNFIVDETLAGRSEELKGYTIGIGVFDRETNFDPENDPIVRIQAGRLRRSLEVYYLLDGKEDPIHIVIPKGGYVPKFLPAGEIQSLSKAEFEDRIVYDKHSSIEPSIAVLPFKNLTGEPDKDYFVQGFTEEISIELTRYEDLKVIGCRLTTQSEELLEDTQDLSNKLGVQFLLEGSVRLDEQQVTVLIKLIDALTGQQIWVERYQRNLSVNNLVMVQEEIAIETARVLGSEYGIILQRLSIQSMRRKPQELDTYEAILRFYYYENHFSPDSALEAYRALEHALQREPTSGIATAMLASLHGNAYMLDLPNNGGALEKMSELAEKALTLDPNSLGVRIAYALKCFACNENEAYMEAVNKCLAMNLNSPMRMGILGFHLALYGEWEQGKALLDKAMDYNIGFPPFFYGATTLYYYRKYDYAKAFKEARNYDVPSLFWGPMLRASVLGQLHRKNEAQPEIQHLKSLKPDFESKADYLISRFVKEETLVDHILDGLQKAGLKIP
jgi:TolB-like protein